MLGTVQRLQWLDAVLESEAFILTILETRIQALFYIIREIKMLFMLAVVYMSESGQEW